MVRADMALMLSGLFRVTGDRRRHEVELHQAWAGGEVILQGVECDDRDLFVLLVVLVLSHKQEEREVISGRDAPAELIPDRRRGNLALEKDVLRVTTTKAELCRLVGAAPAGNPWQSVSRSLRRLMGVVVEGRAAEKFAMTHLIHAAWSEGGRLELTVSNRLAAAVIGGTSYAAIAMPVFRELKSAPARILFAWLAAWFGGSSASSRKVSINKVEAHVYGGRATERTTILRRRRALASAAEQISATDVFKVSIAGDQVTATRGYCQPRTESLPTVHNSISGNPCPASVSTE